MYAERNDQPRAPRPFVLALIEPLDKVIYADAMADAASLSESYDPITQTSRKAVYAGTQLTYDSTTTSLVIIDTDDTEQDDT